MVAALAGSNGLSILQARVLRRGRIPGHGPWAPAEWKESAGFGIIRFAQRYWYSNGRASASRLDLVKLFYVASQKLVLDACHAWSLGK
jgi:hypothetical protein